MSKSSIDRLPKAVRDSIELEFKRGRLTLDEIVELIRTEFGADKAPSRSALGRKHKKWAEITKEHRDAMEISRMWTEQIGSEPEGDIGRAVIEVLRMLAMRGVRDAYDGGLDPKSLSVLALAMQRIEKAGEIGFKTRLAIREAVLNEVEEKLDKLEGATGGAGKKRVDAESIRLVREALRGEA